jgi:hypothetical protein
VRIRALKGKKAEKMAEEKEEENYKEKAWTSRVTKQASRKQIRTGG